MLAKATQMDRLAIEQQTTPLYCDCTHTRLTTVGIHRLAAILQFHGRLIEIRMLWRPQLHIRDLHLYCRGITRERERLADGLAILSLQGDAATFGRATLLYLQRNSSVELSCNSNIRKAALPGNCIEYDITM